MSRICRHLAEDCHFVTSRFVWEVYCYELDDCWSSSPDTDPVSYIRHVGTEINHPAK